MKLRNLHIGTRLGLGFGLVLLLMMALALASLSRMANIHGSLDKVINENNVIVKELNDMRHAVMTVGVVVRNISVMTQEDEIKTEVRLMDAANAEYVQSMQALRALMNSADDKILLDKIDAGQAEAKPWIDKAVALALKQGDVIPVLLANVVPTQRMWLEAMEETVKRQEALAQQTSADADSAYANALLLTLALAGAALLVGVLIAFFVTRSITSPLRSAVGVARRVADGDLTTQVDVQSTDETGQLMQALKDMNESLVRIVGEVRNGTDTITHASSEIAAGNMNLSVRTEEQASSLQTTASSMEELTSTVKHNAENASQANKLAATASEVAIKGGAVVSQVVDTMGSINDSAKKIVDIIGVIDGIAFQTNILALNAAVEAARAGEQGRGFAVVAAEVRNLAQRSAAAAKEIKALIGDSVEKVEAGAKLVDQAGATMDEVVASVRRVTDIISEIAAASHEQTSGIEQINQAITQMDNVTQQNAALVEEAAAAAGSMQEQAGNLSQVVSVFKMEGNAVRAMDGPAASGTAARPARTVRMKESPAAPVAVRKASSKPALPPSVKTPTDNAEWEEF
ncbi:methyl-accepting chemotaxis protein [Noviherbaspirillum sp.]|uniref:methyl-accepting chemotaxis protein n=1 Tax=Noviherbaspirillum sp. TaxID=1926288 RepID=UPI002FE1050E